MKSLELDTYRVSELSFNEQLEHDGGWIIPILRAITTEAALLIWYANDLRDDPSAHKSASVKGFYDGYNSTKNSLDSIKI